jgi:hypothetical protein
MEIALDDDLYWDLFAVFLYLCDHLPTCIARNHIDFLMSTPLFHPDVTAQDDCEYFGQLNSLRSHAVRAAVKGNFATVVLLKWVHYPELFVEVTHRLISDSQFVITNESSAHAFSRALMTSALYYQQLHHDEDRDVKGPRIALLLLIERLLTKEQVLFFFSNSLFCSLLLSFLFEDSVSEFAFGQLTHLFLTVDELTPALSFHLEQIIHLCLPSFPEQRFVSLVARLLTAFNDGLIHNRVLRKSFEPFCQLFFESFTTFTKWNESLQPYMLQALQFFALAGNEQSLSTPDVEALCPPIQMAFGDELPQLLRVKLIQLIAGEVLPSLNPRFVIRHPRALNVLVKVALRNSAVIECLQFLDELIQFARVNALRCHQSGFDMLLLLLVKDVAKAEVVEALLNLFMWIVGRVSSVPVVQRYISLFSPIKNKLLPNHHDLVLTTIHKIVSQAT